MAGKKTQEARKPVPSGPEMEEAKRKQRVSLVKEKKARYLEQKRAFDKAQFQKRYGGGQTDNLKGTWILN